MNKKTIITILLALVAMSADSQRLNKDVERIQYVYALKVVINDSVWSEFADKQYDVPLLYYGDTCCYVVNPTGFNLLRLSDKLKIDYKYAIFKDVSTVEGNLRAAHQR